MASFFGLFWGFHKEFFFESSLCDFIQDFLLKITRGTLSGECTIKFLYRFSVGLRILFRIPSGDSARKFLFRFHHKFRLEITAEAPVTNYPGVNPKFPRRSVWGSHLDLLLEIHLCITSEKYCSSPFLAFLQEVLLKTSPGVLIVYISRKPF